MKTMDDDRQFPVQDGPSIPWAMIQPHERQAKYNHGQSLERLAERGGLSCYEAVCVLDGRGISGFDAGSKTDEQWRDLLQAKLDATIIGCPGCGLTLDPHGPDCPVRK